MAFSNRGFSCPSVLDGTTTSAQKTGQAKSRDKDGESSAINTRPERGKAGGPRVVVNRPACDLLLFDATYDGLPEEIPPLRKRMKHGIIEYCKVSNLKRNILGSLPFIMTLKTYKLREYLFRDIVAGFSMGIVHVPQGMAFALLAGVPPVYGLYTSFWQPLIYFVFQTCRHNSFGPMAVMSLLLGTVVERESLLFSPIIDKSLPDYNSTKQHDQMETDLVVYKTGIAVCVTLLVGIIQIIMGVFRLGIVTIFMPVSYVSGFTTAAAFHIVSSQLNHVFGVKPKSHQGLFKLPKNMFSFIQELSNTNFAAVIISVNTILFILACKEILNERFKKKFKIPIPAELLVVIIGTAVSFSAKLDTRFEVTIMGKLPRGIPAPAPPPIALLSNVFVDSLVAAILCFVISMSLANTFTRKYKYKVDANQELIAYGMAHAVSSFFRCYPGASAPPRCFIYDGCGGKTSLAHLFSCILLLLVLLAIGPVFEYLPNAVLGSLIIVSLIPLFLQFKDLKTFYRASKFDFWCWIITWLATVVLDMGIGLGVGMAFVIVATVAKNIFARGDILGYVQHQDLYAPLHTHKKASTLEGIRIFRFGAPLFFASSQTLKDELYRTIGDSTTVHKKADDLKKTGSGQAASFILKPLDKGDLQHQISKEKPLNGTIKTIILDCSAFTHLDMVAIATLREIKIDYEKVAVELVLAHVHPAVQITLGRSGMLGGGPDCIYIYPTIQDAVAAKYDSESHFTHYGTRMEQPKRNSYFGLF